MPTAYHDAPLTLPYSVFHAYSAYAAKSAAAIQFSPLAYIYFASADDAADYLIVAHLL